MNSSPSSRPFSVLLADDHALFRDALIAYMMRAEPGMHITVAEDLIQAQSHLSNGKKFDLALMDWHMPGVAGIEDMARLVPQYPDTKFALMSGVIEPDDARHILTSGFIGYFPKTLSGRALVEGVRQVLNGHEFVPHLPGSVSLAPSYKGAGLFYHPRPEQEARPASVQTIPDFTPREQDILRCLIRGLTNAEIATHTGIKEVTVKLHLRNACEKLGARNRTDAALKCRELRIFADV